MKVTSIVVWVSLFIIVPELLNAQPWLYEKDLIVDDDVLHFAVRPVRKGDTVHYHFQLKISEEQIPKTFDISEGSFKQGAYLSRLISLQVFNKYKEFPYETMIYKSVSDFEADIDTSGMDDDKKEMLEDIISDLISIPRMNWEDLNKALKHLKSKIPDANKTWFNEKLAAKRPLITEKWKRIEQDISWQCDSFLVSVFEILYKRNEGGAVTGMLFLQRNPKIRTDLSHKRQEKNCLYGYNEKKRKLEEEQHQIKKDSISLNNNLKDSINHLEVQNAQIRFENGQADIVVNGEANGEVLTFLNRVPISYSTIGDAAQDFYSGNHIRLYAMQQTFNYCFLHFDEVLRNDFRIANFTDNYSPADTTVFLRPNEPGRLVYKEKITDILQARIFTDLIGLDASTPNGLVQVELSKRVFLNTKVKEAWSGLPIWLKKFRLSRSKYAYRGFFHSLTPILTITKIEQDNKYFIAEANSQPGPAGDSSITIRTIDFFRYANMLNGSQLNIYYRGNKKMHYILYADVAAYVMRTGVDRQIQKADTSRQFFSISNEANVNSLVVSPLILFWDYRPHSNYRASLFYNFQKVYALSEEILQPTGKKARDLHTIGLFAAVKFNEEANGELFFRSRLTTGANPKRENFFQAQVGYSFKLFSRKPTIRNRPVFNSGT